MKNTKKALEKVLGRVLNYLLQKYVILNNLIIYGCSSCCKNMKN